MLKHIVMWRFRKDVDQLTPQQHARKMKQQLEDLRGVIEEIHSLECGIDMLRTSASFDLVLTLEVEDAAALARYANNPAHLLIADYAQRVTETRVVVDYLS